MRCERGCSQATKVKNFESVELLMMTALCAVASIIAIVIGHPRMWLMVWLTAFMGLIAFIARYRQNRHNYRTLNGVAWRRRKRRRNG